LYVEEVYEKLEKKNFLLLEKKGNSETSSCFRLLSKAQPLESDKTIGDQTLNSVKL
jgi:hypothetical protein